MKKCSKCKDFKDERYFSKDKNRKDKLYPQCKACRKIYTDSRKEERKAYYQNHIEEAKEYNKVYSKTEKGKELRRKYHLSTKGKEAYRRGAKKYRKNNPLKVRAHWTLYKAVKSGKIIKPKSCSKCGKTGSTIHGHHPSYLVGDELKVIWCCIECHILLDKQRREKCLK